MKNPKEVVLEWDHYQELNKHAKTVETFTHFFSKLAEKGVRIQPGAVGAEDLEIFVSHNGVDTPSVMIKER